MIPESIKKKIVIFSKGFCMGTADVIPGVSGGTMAFILGIYDELINAIKSFDYTWLKSITGFDIKAFVSRPHLTFLIPLFTGIFCALLFFTRIVPLPRLLLDYPEQIYGLFFGLIAGSIIILFQDMLKFRFRLFIPVILGILSGFLVFNLVPVETPDAAWFIYLSGILAICAMILPGISGSFILLILNKYAYIFNAIGYFDFRVIIPFAFGAVTGLVLFSRVLSWLLKNFYQNTVGFIIGLLIASLSVIWPFQQRIYENIRGKQKVVESMPYIPGDLSQTVLITLVTVIIGFSVVFVLNWIVIVKKNVAD